MIVAIDKHNAIASGGTMPWGRSLKDDLKYFRDKTKNTSIIMGRNTFEKDFGSKPLPDRENIVVSSKPTGVLGVLSAGSLKAAYALARYPIFVIGGGQIYASALNDMDTLYVTEVDAEFSGADVFFPAIDADLWKESSREHHEPDERNTYAFDFVMYERR